MIAFAERLRQVIERLDPPLTQAELADKAGVDRSLISRLLQGERPPTNDALRRLAPALGINVEDLVRGTDAVSRLQDAGAVSLTVRHSEYVEALRKNAELEGMLASEVSRRDVAERAASQAHQELEQMRPDLARGRATIKSQEQLLKDLRTSELRYRRMFSDVLSQLQGLNTQVNELRVLLNSTSEELASARKSGRLGTILSGIAAVTSAATLAYFSSRSSDQSEPKAKTKPKAAKQRRNES